LGLLITSSFKGVSITSITSIGSIEIVLISIGIDLVEFSGDRGGVTLIGAIPLVLK